MRELPKIILFLVVLAHCTTKQVVETKRVEALSDLLIRPQHLPKGYALSQKETRQCRTSKAQALITGRGLRYLKRASQTIVYRKQGAFTINIFSTSFDLKKQERLAIKNFAGPSERDFLHPEEVILYKRFVIMLCNGFQSPIRDWYLHRLKARFQIQAKIRLQIYEPDLEKTLAFYWSHQFEKAQAHLQKVFGQLQNRKIAYFLLAEMAMRSRQFKLAEKNYRSYLAIVTVRQFLLADWAAHHGQALALAKQGKLARSVKVFKEAYKIAEKLKRRYLLALSSYDLACAYAELNYQKKAIEFLKKSIGLDLKYKQLAKSDVSFRQLRNDNEFKQLTK